MGEGEGNAPSRIRQCCRCRCRRTSCSQQHIFPAAACVPLSDRCCVCVSRVECILLHLPYRIRAPTHTNTHIHIQHHDVVAVAPERIHIIIMYAACVDIVSRTHAPVVLPVLRRCSSQGVDSLHDDNDDDDSLEPVGFLLVSRRCRGFDCTFTHTLTLCA